LGNVARRTPVSTEIRPQRYRYVSGGLTNCPATTPGALLQFKLNLLPRRSRPGAISLSNGVARLVTLDIAAARSVGKIILRNMIVVVQ